MFACCRLLAVGKHSDKGNKLLLLLLLLLLIPHKIGVWLMVWNLILVKLWLYLSLVKQTVFILISNYVTIWYHAPCFKDLGVLLDCKLYFHQHTDYIFSQDLNMLGLIQYIMSSFSTLDSHLVLYSTRVQSKLKNASVAWKSIKSTDSSKLERIIWMLYFLAMFLKAKLVAHLFWILLVCAYPAGLQQTTLLSFYCAL
jgi:hypothetical protein